MINVVDAAKYLAYKYYRYYNEQISEMKLHRLLYFAQRESLVRTDRPLFLSHIQGWRFGPVIPVLRRQYQTILFNNRVSINKIDKDILEYVLKTYGKKNEWSLSRLTLGEYSWKKSRMGIGDYDYSSKTISISDIRVDALRIRDRRDMMHSLVETQ